MKAGACVASALPRPTSERIWCAYFACVLAVAVFAPGGGFVFDAVHNVQARTPIANVVAMIEAVRQFNRGR